LYRKATNNRRAKGEAVSLHPIELLLDSRKWRSRHLWCIKHFQYLVLATCVSLHHSPRRHLTLYAEHVDHRGIGLNDIRYPAFTVIQRRKSRTVAHRLTLVCTWASGNTDRDHEDYCCHLDIIALSPNRIFQIPEGRFRHTFMFKSPFFGATDSELAVIVHEAVHAGFDVIGDGGKFKRIDNEPSAYMAESFFLLNSGFSFNDIQHVLPLRLAFTVALNMQSKKQSSVSMDDLLLLRNGVARTQITNHSSDTRRGADEDKFRGIAP
jgi:hypothetical protein